MNIIAKDLLTVENGVICHAVNTLGKMGAGLAKQIRDKWPKVYETYKEALPSLGEVQMVYIHSRSGGLWVANLATQDEIGWWSGYNQNHTDYCAVRKCLQRLSTVSPLYFPWDMCCGLGGGSPEIMMALLLRYAPDATICYYNPQWLEEPFEDEG